MELRYYMMYNYICSKEFYTKRYVFNATEFEFEMNLVNTVYYELYGILSVKCRFELIGEGLGYTIEEMCKYHETRSVYNISLYELYVDVYYMTLSYSYGEIVHVIDDKKYIESKCPDLLRFYEDYDISSYFIDIDISQYKFVEDVYIIGSMNDIKNLLLIPNKNDITLRFDCTGSKWNSEDIQYIYQLEGFKSIIFEFPLKANRIDCIYKYLGVLKGIKKSEYNIAIKLSKYVFDAEIADSIHIVIGKTHKDILNLLFGMFDDIIMID